MIDRCSGEAARIMSTKINEKKEEKKEDISQVNS